MVVAEVAEDEAAQVVLGDPPVGVAGVVSEQLVEVLVQVGADDAADELDEPGAVIVVDQPVVEDSQRLVNPETLQLRRAATNT